MKLVMVPSESSDRGGGVLLVSCGAEAKNDDLRGAEFEDSNAGGS